MNVEGIDTPLAQRMVDFLSGAVYCLVVISRRYPAAYSLQLRQVSKSPRSEDDMRNKVFSPGLNKNGSLESYDPGIEISYFCHGNR
jgi:hypothetical protein